MSAEIEEGDEVICSLTLCELPGQPVRCHEFKAPGRPDIGPCAFAAPTIPSGITSRTKTFDDRTRRSS
jgi:hypothetical protein